MRKLDLAAIAATIAAAALAVAPTLPEYEHYLIGLATVLGIVSGRGMLAAPRPSRGVDIRDSVTADHPIADPADRAQPGRPRRGANIRDSLIVLAGLGIGLGGCLDTGDGGGEVVSAEVVTVWAEGYAHVDGIAEYDPALGTWSDDTNIMADGVLDIGATVRVCLATDDEGGEVCGDVMVAVLVEGRASGVTLSGCYWAMGGAVEGCVTEIAR